MGNLPWLFHALGDPDAAYNLAYAIDNFTINNPLKTRGIGRHAQREAIKGEAYEECAHHVLLADRAIHVMMDAVELHVQVSKEDGA